MNAAIWKKAFTDAWLQLAVSSALLLLFSWAFVWLMSMFKIGAWSSLLNLLPGFVQPMLGVPLAELATPTGQLSILYVHAIVVLICVGWALGRGSAPIAGEIGHGTMDLLLSLPIWRISVLVPPAVVATLGAAVLPASVWLGTALGVAVVHLETEVALSVFLPGAVNLFAMTFCLTGITTFISSFNRDRWATIGIAGGFYIVSLMLELIGRLWEAGAWLKYLTFLSVFQPQQLILVPEQTGYAALRYNLVLLGLGLAAYAVAGLILWHRDIPTAR